MSEETSDASEGEDADLTRITPAPRAATRPGSPPAQTSLGAADSFGVPKSNRTERAEIKVGEVLGSTFRIDALLAKGGMGAVYRATHVLLGSQHAVKVILPELAEEEDIVARMTREAITLHDLDNDAVVAYEGFFLDEQGRRYLVMEFVDGPSLAAVLRDRCLAPQEVRTLRDRLALGLAAAHDQGVLHRDLSPDNIILPGGRVENAKIIDFGIAKSKKGGDQTMVGAGFMGKYSYASPEQFDESLEPDGRSDIYSLGLVLAAAAIGFGGKLNMGNSLATAVRARQAVPDLAAVPEELRAEIGAMLQPAREDRPQSMREVVRWGLPVEETQIAPRLRDGGAMPRTLPQPRPRRRSRPMLVPLAAGAVLLGAAGLHVAFPQLLAGIFAADPGVVEGSVDKLLTGVRCGTLSAEVTQDFFFHTHVKLVGVVPTRDDAAKLMRDVGALRQVDDVSSAIQVVDWPFCDLINVAAQTGAKAPPQIAARRPDFTFKDGENYVFNVTAPFAGVLTVDIIDGASGDVLHLLPSPQQPQTAVEAGKTVVVSSAPLKYVVSQPYGTQMVTAILGRQPLFSTPRPQVENAAAYLDALRSAVRTARDRDGAGAVAIGYRLFHTGP